MGVMGLSFSYFMKLRHEPQHNTLTWTLDYRYSSDFGTEHERQLASGPY